MEKKKVQMLRKGEILWVTDLRNCPVLYLSSSKKFYFGTELMALDPLGHLSLRGTTKASHM